MGKNGNIEEHKRGFKRNNCEKKSKKSTDKEKMVDQLMLSSFTKNTISKEKHSQSTRPQNKKAISWDVEYQGYSRGDEGEPKGFIEFHVIAEIIEALIDVREKKNYKKVKRPGYKLIMTQNMAFEKREWESHTVYEESFVQDHLKKAYDAFKREVLNIQSWIEVCESRAKLIPKGRDVFECQICGWVTDQYRDDITCQGCGKRFWSEKMWKKGEVCHPQEARSN